MYLYYDRLSQVFTLDLGDDVMFLGPITNTLMILKRTYALTDSQAREAVLQAVFNMGDSVDLETIKKIASTESMFYSTVSEHTY